MSFTQQIGNPNATYPPSLTLAQSANGVGLVSIGSDVKYVTFNPIPSYSWIPLSTNPYENYFFEWYTGTDFDGDYYEGYTPDFATFNALNVRTLGMYYDEPRLSGIINLDQYPNLDTLDLEYYDGNDISFLYTLPANKMKSLFLFDFPNVSSNYFTSFFKVLSTYQQLTYLGCGEFTLIPTAVDNLLNSLNEMPLLSGIYLTQTGITSFNNTFPPWFDNITIAFNPLSSLNVTNMSNLKQLTLVHTQLSAINLSNNLLLESLVIDNTPITAIDVSMLHNLQVLQLQAINSSVFTDLEIINLPHLAVIYLNNISLSTLTLSSLPSIQQFTTTYVQTVILDTLPTVVLFSFPAGNIVIQNLSALTQINFTAQPNLSAISVAQCVNLFSVNFLGCENLSYVDITGISAQYVNFISCALPLSAVNHIAIQCDLGGRTNGQLYLNGGTNSPLSGDGITAKNNLVAKGWTIQNNT